MDNLDLDACMELASCDATPQPISSVLRRILPIQIYFESMRIRNDTHKADHESICDTKLKYRVECDGSSNT